MKTKKFVIILLVLGSFMAVAGTSSADVISYSDNVSFDHDQVVTISVYNCPASLTYTFLSDTVSLSQFDPWLGILNSVELKVESDIDVETYYYYHWPAHTTSQWWYSNVIGSVNGLEATIEQSHNHHTTGRGNYNYLFTIDGNEPNSASSGLAGFIGTGLVDVAITGDDKLCAWWNSYTHYDTDTYGTVTATLTYNYTPVKIDIKPGSCPNPFNAKSKGSVPVAIVGSADLDVTTINPASITLAGVPALVEYVIKDSTEPHESDPQAEECEDCFDADDSNNFNCDEWDATDPNNPPVPGQDGIDDSYCGDGYLDLVVKFDTRKLAAAIGRVPRDTCVVLTLNGLTKSGMGISGSDSVLTRKK